MDYVKQHRNLIQVLVDDPTKEEVNKFFLSRRELKKGPTILRWILEGIARDGKK